MTVELTLRIKEEGSGRIEEQTVETVPGTEIREVLQEHGINPQTVLVERDNTIVTHRDEIQKTDTELTVLNVISGG